MSTPVGWDERLQIAILSAALVVARHWLTALNAMVAVFIALALLAPLLMANGQARTAAAIYDVYRLTCHQQPERSYFLGGPRLVYSPAQITESTELRPLAGFTGNTELGYKMAFCQRDLATYAAILLFGLLWPRLRRRLPRLPLRAYLALLLPLAVDGLSQAAGLRESTWLLRTLTGGLFGFATAWMLLPELEAAMADAVRSLSTRLQVLRTHQRDDAA